MYKGIYDLLIMFVVEYTGHSIKVTNNILLIYKAYSEMRVWLLEQSSLWKPFFMQNN